jgi:hypothetical protein
MRRNTFSGLLYRDDPALFGWNLMNEPRSTKDLVVGLHGLTCLCRIFFVSLRHLTCTCISHLTDEGEDMSAEHRISTAASRLAWRVPHLTALEARMYDYMSAKEPS